MLSRRLWGVQACSKRGPRCNRLAAVSVNPLVSAGRTLDHAGPWGEVVVEASTQDAQVGAGHVVPPQQAAAALPGAGGSWGAYGRCDAWRAISLLGLSVWLTISPCNSTIIWYDDA